MLLWPVAAIALLLALHNNRSPLGSDGISGDKDVPRLNGFACNESLFPKHIAVVLRLTLRFFRKLANFAKRYGFRFVEKKLNDTSLNLFVFFFVRFHGDILGRGYEDFISRFYPESNDKKEPLQTLENQRNKDVK
jgi:hypothetical protein